MRNLLSILFLLILASFCKAQNTANDTISPFFTRVYTIMNGYALVDIGEKEGIVNSEGIFMVPCIYDNINVPDASPYFYYGVVPVMKNGRWGVVDTTGKRIVPFIYDNITPFYDFGKSIVQKDGKMGCIDYTGRIIIPIKLDSIVWPMNEGLWRVVLNGKTGYIDSSGKQIIPFKYDAGLSCSEGLIPVEENGKWGFIDKKGNCIIPFMYDEVSPFSDSLAAVVLNYKTGFIDKHNKMVIPFQYDEGYYQFRNGFASVVNYGRSGVINKIGKVIIPFKYKSVEWFSRPIDFIVNNESGKYALFDSLGKALTGFDYEDMFEGGNIYQVKKNDKYGTLNSKGNNVIPLKYNSLLWFSGYNIETSGSGDTLIYIDSLGHILFSFECLYNQEEYSFPDVDEFLSFFADTVTIVPYHSFWRIINRKGQFVDHFAPNQDVKLYYDNGTPQIIGKIRNFYKEGTWKQYYENGHLKKKSAYLHGLKKGKEKNYFENGQLQTYYHYTHGLYSGVAKEYYENGTLKSETAYLLGKQEGKECKYYSTGKLSSISYFKDDFLQSAKRYDESGNLYEEIDPNDSGANTMIHYNKNGKISLKTYSTNAGKTEVAENYYENGKLKSVSFYNSITNTGMEKDYYENGNIKTAANYSDYNLLSKHYFDINEKEEKAPDFVQRHDCWWILNTPDISNLLSIDSLELCDSHLSKDTLYINFDLDSNSFILSSIVGDTMLDEQGHTHIFKYGNNFLTGKWEYTSNQNQLEFIFPNKQPLYYTIKPLGWHNILLVKDKSVNE